MKKKIAAIALACGMALSLAACGGSSSSSSSGSGSSSSSSSSSASSASSETAASSESVGTTASSVTGSSTSASSEIGDFTTVEEGKLHMATNAAFPPYESTTDDGGFEGIDVDVAEKIADKLGLELVIDDMDFSAVITSVQSGKEDMAMAGLTVNEERKKNVDFTDSYANTVQVVIVPEDSDIKTVDDLQNNKKVGCQEGTTGYTLASDSPENGGVGDNAIAYADGATAVQAMISGKVDAVIIDEQPAKEYVKANEGLKILDTEYTNEEYAIGVSKENPELLKAINTALNQLKDDGTLQEIMDKYIAS